MFSQRENETQGCSIHVRARVRMSYCTTELYLSVDNLKKKQTTRKTEAGRGRCQCTDVNVYVMYNLSHVETERTYTPAQLQTLVEAVGCHHRSFPFVPPSAISRKRYQPASNLSEYIAKQVPFQSDSHSNKSQMSGLCCPISG